MSAENGHETWNELAASQNCNEQISNLKIFY